LAQANNAILIVDDEPGVLRVATAAISTLGFRVIVAENGAVAWEEWQAHRDEICLVLSDVVMPEMDGLALAEKILEADPEAKILMMSGYSDAALEVRARKTLPFIRKPFLTGDLLRKIASMTEGAMKTGPAGGQGSG
jgi:two-component system cell cycle sensor histidine kinase/response regulator CckA